jgi:hypothetical protein
MREHVRNDAILSVSLVVTSDWLECVDVSSISGAFEVCITDGYCKLNNW